MAARLLQSVCRNNDSYWEDTEIERLQVPEVSLDQVSRRLIVIRQLADRRINAGGKMLFEVACYRFRTLVTTNLPTSVRGVAIWRRCNGGRVLKTASKNLGTSLR